MFKMIGFLLFGGLFGFLLSRAGATTYDFYANLFLFEDMRLAIVIGSAVAVGAPGVWLLKRARAKALFDGKPIAFKPKGMKRELPVGAVLLGLGWGIAGACPGTVMAMLGEGKFASLFVIAGVLAGTYAYGLANNRNVTPLPTRDDSKSNAA